jgi:hypothetical protein
LGAALQHGPEGDRLAPENLRLHGGIAVQQSEPPKPETRANRAFYRIPAQSRLCEGFTNWQQAGNSAEFA